MGFCEGDRVEVCVKEDGFLGSHFEAKVLDPPSEDNPFVVVQYKRLIVEEGSLVPLIEKIAPEFVRPAPPQIPATGAFSYLEKVDAFDLDSWWVGRIVGREFVEGIGQAYLVKFEITGEELYAYPSSRLRVHLDWDPVSCKWFRPRRKEAVSLD